MQENNTDNLESITSLHRYFIWADRMRVHFDQTRRSGQNTQTNQHNLDSFLYMSYWYASLYTVIEGWKKLKLGDEVIHILLQSQNVDLLRKYRNGTFHFRAEYYDKNRFLPLILSGTNVVPWVRALNNSFSDYFLNHIKQQKKL